MNLRVTGAGLTLTMLLTAGCPAFATASVATSTAAEVTEAEPEVVPESGAMPLFVPTDFNVPILVETKDFKLVPLGPELVNIDFDAYMSSIEHIQKTFTRSTNWPRKDISNADAMKDMKIEQARFKNRESFAFAVLTPDGSRERGSLYVYPSAIEGYDAVVTMWVTKAEYDAGFDVELYEWATNWVKTDWPFEKVAYPARAIDWDSWDAIVAADSAKEVAPEELNH